MTQSQQLRKLAAQSATAFLVAALCAFPLYIDKFSNLGVVKFTAVCTLCWAFALWLGALRAVGAAPQPGRLPWRQDPALWALGAVTVSGVVSTALSAIDSLSPDSRQNRTPTVILTAAALALTASVRSSSSETRSAPVRLPICFKEIVIFKNRPFQPQRRLCAFQNGTRRNLSPQK